MDVLDPLIYLSSLAEVATYQNLHILRAPATTSFQCLLPGTQSEGGIHGKANVLKSTSNKYGTLR